MNLEMLKRVVAADVYKNGTLAGTMGRMDSGVVRFAYTSDYLAAGHPQVAFSLPLSSDPVETTNGAIPAFFAGLLPEGHRLTVLKNAAKTSFDDELTLLLAVGADVPGDVQIVPAGEAPVEPRWSPTRWQMLRIRANWISRLWRIPWTCMDCPAFRTRQVHPCSPRRWQREGNDSS